MDNISGAHAQPGSYLEVHPGAGGNFRNEPNEGSWRGGNTYPQTIHTVNNLQACNSHPAGIVAVF